MVLLDLLGFKNVFYLETDIQISRVILKFPYWKLSYLKEKFSLCPKLMNQDSKCYIIPTKKNTLSSKAVTVAKSQCL